MPTLETESLASALSSGAPELQNRRLLLIDDNTAIHEDIRKILGAAELEDESLDDTAAALFGTEAPRPTHLDFKIDSAYQGQEGLALLEKAVAEGNPYALAFVDIRMPPGWDGIETVSRLWKVCPDLQVVICTAYSDYSWEGMIRAVGQTDSLVILKKPFDNIEVLQLAHTLTQKWNLRNSLQGHLGRLDEAVARRTMELEEANALLRLEIKEREQAQHEQRQLETRLRQSQKLEAVGQLAAGVAHDFNNILTIIQGHATMQLAGPDLLPDVANSFDQVSLAAERAAGLTRQLLAFSRRQIVLPRALDLNAVVQNLLGLLRRVIGEHIDLRYTFAEGLPPIFADESNIEQIVMNLVVNSRDAMSYGGRLSLKTSLYEIGAHDPLPHPNARPGKFARLSVSDTGCGMTAETLNHIFEPFFTTKQVGQGTGLGLATVYGIVSQHAGWIEVESELGRGTTFSIHIPISEHAVEGAPSSEPGDGFFNPGEATGGHETILLVEDEADVREIATEILQQQGYRILCAGDGPGALDVWARRSHEIDLLVTDMVMPNGLKGDALAARLRVDKPSLRVIYSSGYSQELAADNALPDTNSLFLQKPYKLIHLLRAVRTSLDEPVTQN